MTSDSPTIHVIDDDDAMRASLAFLLESAGLTCRTYASAPDFLTHCAQAEIGCVITDVRMPEMGGLQLVAELKARNFRLPVIVITGHGDVPLAVEAMKNGVVDFIEKPFDDELLLGAIQRAMTLAPPDAPRNEAAAGFAALLASLSPRETEVLRGVVDGKPNKVIAFELGISPRTVEVYRANVMTKTGAHSLSELVRMALVAGF